MPLTIATGKEAVVMSRPVEARQTPWKTILLICGKCARKMDGGYGPKGKDSLRMALRTALKVSEYGRSVRIIETRCMGICPKKGVTAVNASRPDMIATVPKGTGMEETISLLL
jgi:predicted metal-binding protein